ncbi:MAG: hypothetical protein R3E95_22790 [Thiolinea sp.]
MAADALVSVGVVVSGIRRWYLLSCWTSLLSLIIAAIIVTGTLGPVPAISAPAV